MWIFIHAFIEIHCVIFSILFFHFKVSLALFIYVYFILYIFLIRWFLTATSGTKCPLGMFIFSCTKEKDEVPFSMAIENWELMHECFPKHSRMGTARMK